jgi:hypothetical protein
VEDLVRCLDDLLTVTADSQQRSRQQGEHLPVGCAGPLKKVNVKSVKSGTDGNGPTDLVASRGIRLSVIP